MKALVFAADIPVEPDGMAILIPPVYEIFWSAIIFLGLWLVLGKALPKIYGMLDTRQEEIEKGLRAADKAQEDAALAERERRDTLREANDNAREIRERAEQDATRIVKEAQAQANAEAIRISENATRQIDAERQAAELHLRRDVGELATELAEKIIGEQLKDKALTDRVVNRFMDELEADLQVSSDAAGVAN